MNRSQVNPNRETRMHGRGSSEDFVECLVLLLLFTALTFSQSTDRLHRFFKQDIGLNDSEIVDIDQGKAVAKVLDPPTASEVFVFGSVFIKPQPREYVHLAADLDYLKSLPDYLAIRRFSNPPQLSDLSGFELDPDDVKDLKECKTEHCEIQLPAENIEQF